APADRLAVHLGEPPDVRAREAAEEVLADGEAEHAVAQEREPPVGVGAMPGPGGMGDGLAPQLFGEARDQLGEGPFRFPVALAAPPEAAQAADASRHPTGWLRGGAQAARDEVHRLSETRDVGRLLVGRA